MKRLLLAFIAAIGPARAADYPAQAVNRVDSVHFGQAQAEIELLLEARAVADRDPFSRAGKDFVLSQPATKLDFDAGRLVRITFKRDFEYAAPVAAYPVSWRNFEPIGESRVRTGMMKADFMDYMKAWEARAQGQGARRKGDDDLLADGEYAVSITDDGLLDMVHIAFGPQRSTGKGGSWGDGCSVNFITARMASLYGRQPGSLDAISVFCDAFNTRGRSRPKPAPPTGPAGAPDAGQVPRQP